MAKKNSLAELFDSSPLTFTITIPSAFIFSCLFVILVLVPFSKEFDYPELKLTAANISSALDPFGSKPPTWDFTFSFRNPNERRIVMQFYPSQGFLSRHTYNAWTIDDWSAVLQFDSGKKPLELTAESGNLRFTASELSSEEPIAETVFCRLALSGNPILYDLEVEGSLIINSRKAYKMTFVCPDLNFGFIDGDISRMELMDPEGKKCFVVGVDASTVLKRV